MSSALFGIDLKYIFELKISLTVKALVSTLSFSNKFDSLRNQENLSKFIDNISKNNSIFEKSDVEKAEIQYKNEQFEGILNVGYFMITLFL